ncbi:YlxR family protein [Candidatus Poribacteria bacterium]|nr:YlxR family protein [Candidatus Poribacteria bacterium]
MKLLRDVIRTCIGCQGKFPQRILIRFVGQKDSTLQIDNEKKLDGRGAYVCRAETCILKAFKSPRRINSLLRTQLTHAVIEQFEKKLLQWAKESDNTTRKKEVLL